MVQNWEEDDWVNYGVSVRADPFAGDSYRQFHANEIGVSVPQLRFNWRNTLPAVPDAISPTPGAVLNTGPDELLADAFDADNDDIVNVFDLQRQESDRTWTTVLSQQQGRPTTCCESGLDSFYGLPDLGTGVYRWRVYTRDDFNGSGWSGWFGFEVNGPPDTPVQVEPDDGEIVTSPVDLQAIYDDAQGDVGDVHFELERTDGSGAWTFSDFDVPAGGTATVDAGSLAHGWYRWRVHAVDEHGHVSDVSGFDDFAVDEAPDVPTLVEPPDGWQDNDRPDQLSATYSDPEGDDGQVEFEIRDAAGTVVDSGTSTTVTSGSTATWQPAAALGEGDYTWRARAHDSFGATSGWSASRSFVVDATGPTIDSLDAAAPHDDPQVWAADASVDWSWTASDAGSGVDGYSWAFNTQATYTVDDVKEAEETTTSTTTTAPSSGTWLLHLAAVDNVGNWSATASRQVKIDLDAPSDPAAVASTSHAPYLGSSNRDVSVTWAPSTDEHSGVSHYEYGFFADDTAPAAYPSTTTDTDVTQTLDEGTWWFHVAAVDNVGNTSGDVAFGPIIVDDTSSPLPLSPTIGNGQRAQSDELGVEHWFAMDGFDAGIGDGLVNLRTGNTLLRYTDETIPAQGLNVVVRHVYNSQRADRQLADALLRPSSDTGVGLGWSLSVADADVGLDGAGASFDLGAAIVTKTYEDTDDAVRGRIVELVDGDGTTHRFVRRGGPGGRWTAPPGLDLRLTETDSDGDGIADEYRFTRPDGVTYVAKPTAGLVADATGLPAPTWRLVAISDRNGNELTFTYGTYQATDPADPLATIPVVRIEQVAHNGVDGDPATDNRLVDFVWTAEGRLDRIVSLPAHSAPDPGDPAGAVKAWQRTHEFTVGDDGLLDEVVNNTQATDVAAGRRQVTFAYDANDRIDTITGARANADANPAASTGLVLEADGTLISRVDREGHTWAYDYQAVDDDGDATPERYETTLTPPGPSQATTYTISTATVTSGEPGTVSGRNIIRIQDAGVRAGPTDPLTPVADTFTWEDNRLTAHTNGTGDTTSQGYDDYGHLTTTTSPPVNDETRSGLPSSAATGPVTSTIAYRYSQVLAYDECAGHPDTATSGDIAADGSLTANCYAVADISKTIAADSHDAQQRVTDYVHDLAGNLTQLTQRDTTGGDRVATFAYYTHGGLKQVDGPRTDVTDVTVYGDTTDAAYGGASRSGQPGSITDAAGNTATFAYTPYGQLAKSTDRAGHVTYQRYNHRGLPTATVDPRGEDTGDHATYTTTFEHNADDLKTTDRAPSGLTSTWTYDYAERQTARTHGPDTITQTAYNPDGTVATTTNAVGGDTTYSYWPNGQRNKQVAPADEGEQAITEWFHDAAGRTVRTVGPEANDAGDRPETTTVYAPAGTTAEQAATQADGTLATTMFAYNAHGQQIQTQGPRNDEETRAVYDAFGQQVEQLRLIVPHATGEGKWLATVHGYDPAGNLTSTTQPHGGPDRSDDLTATYTYDVLNRLNTTTDPSNPKRETRFEWTPDGLQAERVEHDTSTNSDVRSTQLVYNVDGTVARQVHVDHDDGDVLAGCAAYNVDGLPVEIVVDRYTQGDDYCNTPGQRVRRQTFAYDTRNRLDATTQEVVAPSGATISRDQSFTYRADSTLATATHNGKTITYDYPSTGVSGAAWNDWIKDWRGFTSTMALTPSGQRSEINLTTDAWATFERHSNGLLRRLEWTRSSGGTAVRTHSDMTYDEAGTLTAGHVDVLMPDGTRKSGDATFTHDVAGRLTSWTSPYPYSTLDSGRATTEFILDEGGNVEDETVTTPNPTKPNADVIKRDIDYLYDRNRLFQRQVTDRGEGTDPDTTTDVTYQYNAIGDETARDVSVQSTTTASHELVRTYSASGHVSSVTHVPEGSVFDPVDYEGQVLAPPEGGWQVLYRYDLSNRLISRQEGGDQAQDPGDTVYFYWGTSNVLAEETDADGTPKRRYLVDAQLQVLGHQTWTTGPDGEVDTSQGIKWVWTLPDEQGNTATLLERDGTVVEQKAYGPYGRPDDAGSQRKDPDLLGDDWDPESILGFQSSPTDAMSGNVLLGPRQYDPESLRFTNSDTHTSAGLDLQLGTDPLTGNRYIFAAANPVAFFDDGHGPDDYLAACQGNSNACHPTIKGGQTGSQADFLAGLKGTIEAVSSHYSMPAAVIAGVIEAERTLDAPNFFERVLGEGVIGEYLCMKSESKYSAACQQLSFGVSQMQVRRAMLVDDDVKEFFMSTADHSERTRISRGWVNAPISIVDRLQNDQMAVAYIGAYMSRKASLHPPGTPWAEIYRSDRGIGAYNARPEMVIQFDASRRHYSSQYR